MNMACKNMCTSPSAGIGNEVCFDLEAIHVSLELRYYSIFGTLIRLLTIFRVL